MPYIIETWDKPNSLSLRMLNRPDHLQYLAKNAKVLLACGAKLNHDASDLGGGLYIIDTENEAEAQKLIEEDPFYKAGLFERVSVTRWRKAYVAGVCYLE
ncbi:YciI family protein [Pseudomonas abietaniphila]|uniref:YciI family protein n=1 Tax=Pseudomonas abietaniphila TaxID=89065 RepID=UPI003217A0B1